MKRPSYQWYPGDHRRDTALQSCSWEARALWRDLLDLMHDGEPYGHLAVNNRPLTPPQIARMIGSHWRHVRRRLSELEAAGVFSLTPSGMIYSRRMVRDERTRQARAAGGHKSLDNPNVPRPKPEMEGYPSEDPSRGPSGDPLGGPLQFASAVAVASTSSSSPARALDRLRGKLPPDHWPDLDKLVDRVPDLVGWCGELEMLVEGGSAGAGVTYADLGRALHDYSLNGKGRQPNAASFRNYVRRAKDERENPPIPRRSGGHAADADAAGVERAKAVAERIDREAARKRGEKNHAY